MHDRLRPPCHFLPVVVVLITFGLASACSRANVVASQPVTVRVAGSTSAARALQDLANTYQAAHPNAVIDSEGGGSTAGVEALTDGRADIAVISWLPPGSQVAEGLQAIPFARDAIAIIVHPTNRVQTLTLLQIKSLYQGEALDWSAVGGEPVEPIIVSREDGSGTRAAFEAMLMGGDRVTLNAVVMPGSQAVVDFVAKHPTAIGYVSMAEVDATVRAVSVEGVAPEQASVQSGGYHLNRLLYLVLPNSPQTAARAFADFILSPAGQAVVARHHVAIR